jgi:ATP-binding cassette subfamily F protein uup
MPNLLISLQQATIGYGGKPLFENLDLNIHEGDKISLVGKNGAGKSTLMQMITGDKELDAGDRKLAPNVEIGYLQQDVKPKKGETIREFIYNALSEEKQTEEYSYLIDIVCEPLDLDKNREMQKLSGGQLRRASLARALVESPEILLLDEPTNHLDLEAIEWLEVYLSSYRGALICVSHDKQFLKNISNKVFWIDRGSLRVCPKGFKHFEEWSENLLDQEARELERRKKIVAQEVDWATKGIKARRKRNVRRVEEAKKAKDKLKADLSSYRKATNKIEIFPIKEEESSKIVCEFYNTSKSFNDDKGQEVKILDKFSLKIIKGDRIGILGKNGSGKTTFLKMLLGEVEPDSGTIKLAKNLEISYFDQKRQDLDDEETLWKTLAPTSDYVEVGKKTKHVCGYLKDFMFDPKDAKNLVGTLSGGQKNRLMLAKTLASPKSLLILDEPTNDLDMETLDMLEEIISNYKGTLLIVSHDRDFLDQTVSKILAFEGKAKIQGHIGGYSDYLENKKKEQLEEALLKDSNSKNSSDSNSQSDSKNHAKNNNSNKPKKLSYKYQYELDRLPEKIAGLEKEIEELSEYLSDPQSYSEDPKQFEEKSILITKLKQDLENSELRWLELEEMKAD